MARRVSIGYQEFEDIIISLLLCTKENAPIAGLA